MGVWGYGGTCPVNFQAINLWVEIIIESSPGPVSPCENTDLARFPAQWACAGCTAVFKDAMSEVEAEPRD